MKLSTYIYTTNTSKMDSWNQSNTTNHFQKHNNNKTLSIFSSMNIYSIVHDEHGAVIYALLAGKSEILILPL